MTAISPPAFVARTTAFERLLLRTATALDLFVAARLARRTSAGHRQLFDARAAFSEHRRNAEAHGVIGLLPR